MQRTLFLALMCALVFSESAALLAQTQNPGAVTGAAAQANGVISGTVSSSTGRPLSGITIQLVDARGTPVGRPVTTSRDGAFSFPPVSYQTYTLQCLEDGKVVGTSSVILTAPTQSVSMTCSSDTDELGTKDTAARAWWKKAGVLTGLLAAAVGTAALVATRDDASGSR